MEKENLKTVALIGRPNVGKSSLFNRLIGRRVAIETPIAGTTRDRIYDVINWNGQKFQIMDVAGVEAGSKNEIGQGIKESVDVAIESADLILFIVDWNDKNNEQDKIVSRRLRSTGKNVLLVVNKADNVKRQQDVEEFKRLGNFEIIAASAINGKNTGDLLDKIILELSKVPTKKSGLIENENEIKLAIVGRPNVGKSTLLNTIIGEKRAIVAEEAGTTRDIVNVSFYHKGKKMILADTAGIRRRGKIVKDTMESLGVLRTYQALKHTDIAILIIDAREGLVANDTHILGDAKEWGKGIILAVNKIDLIEKNREEFIDEMLWTLQNKLNFAPWLPVVFISAKDDENIKPLLDQVAKVDSNRRTEIPEIHLKEITDFIKNSNAQLVNLKHIKQKNIMPPTFEVGFSGKRLPHETQIRYMENKIRDAYPLTGTPIYIDIEKKGLA